MSSVSADCEQNLPQQFVGGLTFSVDSPPELRANLGELAWPVSQNQRSSAVVLSGVPRSFGPIVASAGKPTAPELIFSGAIPPKGALSFCDLLALAPNNSLLAVKEW